MDEHLRRLERRYQATGAAQDLISYFITLFRVELFAFFDRAINTVITNREQTPVAGRQHRGYDARS